MRPLSRITCLLLFPVLWAPRAAAQEPSSAVPQVRPEGGGSEDGEQDLGDLSLEELMNIDVEVTTVSRKSETLSKSAAAVYVITAEDMGFRSDWTLGDGSEWTLQGDGYRVRPTTKTSVDLALFLHQCDNLFTTEFEAVGLVAPGVLEQELIFDNQMDGVAYGFEIAGQCNVTKRWPLHANYSPLQMDLDADATSTAPDPEGAEDESPTNQAHVRSYLQPTIGF